MPPENYFDRIRQYAALVEAALPPIGRIIPECEPADVIQVERGLVFPFCLLRLCTLNGRREPQASETSETSETEEVGEAADRFVDRLIDLAPQDRGPAVVLANRRGHRRPAYRGLLVYSWLRAERILSQSPAARRVARWGPPLARWCRELEADATGLGGRGAIPAADGAGAGAACWAALALDLAGRTFTRDAWVDSARAVFARVAEAQQPNGALLSAGPADNPETLWYHELVMLHAAASYAVQAGNGAVGQVVTRAADYHLAETQPDHATAQPWALFAFAASERAHSLADELLHGAAVHAALGAGRAGGDGVSSILLADALYCLRVTSHSSPVTGDGSQEMTP